MNKFSKYFLSGIFLLVMLLSMWFVFADSYDEAPGVANGSDTISMLIFNISNNSGTPDNLVHYIMINNTGTASIGNLTNITISNGTWVNWNQTLEAFPVNITIDENVTFEQNFTVNFTLDSSAKYGVTLNASVTEIGNETNVSYSALPYYSGLTTIGDNIDPEATASCSPTTLYSGSSFPCTCSGTDSSFGSGVDTSVGSSTSSDGTSTPISTGTFTYTCTVTDNAGNSASATATYTVGRAASSSGTTTPSLPKKIHSWTLITPGVAAIMKDFDSEIGVKQIRVRVRNEVQNVEITVTKYSAKPAEVSVAKTGETYQYLHINAENFGEDLEQATVEFRAERTWAAGVGLGKNDIAVFRYNETASRWNELTTTSTGEDTTYYYYDVEVEGFSYFAISEKSVVGEEEEEEEGERNLTWLWILIAVVIIVIIVWQMKTKKK